jgi:hypothetical protein
MTDNVPGPEKALEMIQRAINAIEHKNEKEFDEACIPLFKYFLPPGSYYEPESPEYVAFAKARNKKSSK